MHVLHQGRAEYTLITPGTPPKIERKVQLICFRDVMRRIDNAPQVMGFNIHDGELLQLLVPIGVWKMSRLLEADLVAASTDAAKDRCGCLITEVVFPGFVWEDHAYLTHRTFGELCLDKADELIGYVKQE